MSVSPIEEAIQDMRQGKMIILVDDEDRENEGDLIVAADKAGGAWTLTRLDFVTAMGPEAYNTQPLLP